MSVAQSSLDKRGTQCYIQLKYVNMLLEHQCFCRHSSVCKHFMLCDYSLLLLGLTHLGTVSRN